MPNNYSENSDSIFSGHQVKVVCITPGDLCDHRKKKKKVIAFGNKPR